MDYARQLLLTTYIHITTLHLLNDVRPLFVPADELFGQLEEEKG